MTSDVGILKIGIADDPLHRMKAVKKVYPVITGFYQAWGMSRRQAEFVERMVHRRLVSHRHKNELFTMSETHAATEIETVIGTLGITAFPFVPFPIPAKKPRKKQKERARKPKTPKVIFTFRLATDLREEAQRAATAEARTLTNWLAHLISCELAALKRGEPPASLTRDSVTDRHRAA